MRLSTPVVLKFPALAVATYMIASKVTVKRKCSAEMRCGGAHIVSVSGKLPSKLSSHGHHNF
jgi:hypothetical protein